MLITARSYVSLTELARADKLSETKRVEREARVAAQREHQAAKDKRDAQRLAEAATSRDLRAYHGNSKRHLKEVKEACSRFWRSPNPSVAQDCPCEVETSEAVSCSCWVDAHIGF